MLLILYGATSELGRKCRDYLQNKGYEFVDKYSYAEEKPIFKSRFGQRVYLSKDEFYSKTDSLFRYNVANIQVGFNWEQISDAVYKNKEKLLTCASADVGMLRRIKEVYKEKVRIIYCYVDAIALEGLFVDLPGITAEEYGSRMAMGLSVKKCYSQNADLFDAVVIYGGESSVFNFKTVFQQLDAIVDEPERTEDNDNKRYDIFVSVSQKDTIHSEESNRAEFIEELIDSLTYRGIRVFYPCKDLRQGDSFFESIKEEICRSRVFLPIITDNSLNSSCFEKELEIAIQAAKNSALIIKPISLDGANLPDWMNEYTAYNVSSEHYQGSVNFVEDWFVSMFSGESTLKKLSEEIDTCISTGLYERAWDLQGSYVTTLHNHLSMWHRKGTVEKINAWITYLDLSILVKKLKECDVIIKQLLSEITDDLDVIFFKRIVIAIVDYCSVADKSADSMYEKFYEFLNISPSKREQFFGIFNSQYDSEHLKQQTDVERKPDVVLADKIAAYSNASVELFEALFKNGIAIGYREALISAYNRIIDYCKTVSLGNSITEKCIDRISELKSSPTTSIIDETEDGKKTLHSLKVYLGQALPDTGSYDLFISHKSADDMLADKVYDYLRNCGFEVFCDHHTLGKLRDSNYDKRIMEALEKSKHLILVASSPDYIKDGWVYDEWHHFHSDKRNKYRNGNLIMILSDDLLPRKSELPIELRDGYEIIKTSEFRDKITNYLW